MPPRSEHVPVMLAEVLAWLDPRPGQVFVDGTLGGGGHTRAIAERVGPSGLVIALDRDRVAVERARGELADTPVRVVQANYRSLTGVLEELQIKRVSGTLLDLGLSSDQLADRERGFSFDAEGPLDLRFDTGEGEPASELVNRMKETALADLIYQLGEERFSRRIARRIVEQRQQERIETAHQLAEIVRRAVPRSADTRRIDPATRTFQALRIAVNDELGALDQALAEMPDCLEPGGKLAIISFHSLEDRRVKEAFRGDDRWQPLTKKPLRASEQETLQNPRARSAKLRVAARRV
ncbi:MAG TPA: 16S rRNA (cytosine(1402)-N(4))-methyltransferase RsmH [Pirellulales bacterium]|nr:16S rRNA (cytosine(1402)-N(4))-methyltransferase RsmH [Pirellulales bacterium]